MRKLLILVGLLGLILIPNMAQAVTEIEYCVGTVPTDDIYYRIVVDHFNFTNSSLYPFNSCFLIQDKTNITIDFNGSTIYPNDTTNSVIINSDNLNSFTLWNGTIDYSRHGTIGQGIRILSGNLTDIYLYNISVLGASIANAGLFFGNLASTDETDLTVIDSTFTNIVGWDIVLYIEQDEITSCGNVYDSFNPTGSLLSKDSCSVAPAEYKDYIRQVNCTASSSTADGALVCSNAIPIPTDCTNITTDAWTVLTVANESWLNDNMSFTRFTCNPEGDRITHCDNLFRPCTYFNFNSFPSRRWDDYAAGQNATSFHVVSVPPSCLDNDGGNFTMIGRLHLACKSFTVSGVEVDGQEEDCNHEMLCFNSNTMEERFTDCTSILTPCQFSCVEGICLAATTTTLREGADPLIDLSPYGAGEWVSMLFTPFSIITMMLVGIGAYFEAQVKDAKGGIFLAVMIVGVLAFTYLGLYPAWIGILIAIVCAGILSKFVMRLW